jgi:hypothetical protein
VIPPAKAGAANQVRQDRLSSAASGGAAHIQLSL